MWLRKRKPETKWQRYKRLQKERRLKVIMRKIEKLREELELL